MMRLRHKLLIHAFRVLDQFMLIGTLLLLVALVSEHGNFRFIRELIEGSHPARELAGGALLIITWVFIFSSMVHYDANRFTTLKSVIQGLLKATTLATFVLFVVTALYASTMLNRWVVILFWISTSLLGIASRIVMRWLLTIVRRSGLNCRSVVFVGTTPHAISLAKRIEAKAELGCQVAGFIAEDDAPPRDFIEKESWRVVGTISQMKSFLERGAVDEVIVCLSLKDHFKQIYETFQLCRDLGVVARLIPDVSDVKALNRLQVEMFEGDYVVTFFRENLIWQLLAKRVMDFGLSTILLIVLSPFLLVIGILILLTSPGPVFFVQERIGMNQRRFKLLKFRSMCVDAEERRAALAGLNEMDGPVFKIKNDPRVTPIGRFIRKTSIDELPQLINVLKGEMSLVGPRPPLPTEADQYEWVYRRRLSIKPGITCLWQVSGRNNVAFKEWMEMDRHYVENWSIWLDLKILLWTIPVVLLRKGAS